MTGHTTRILQAACRGDADAAEQLFPLVYDELRQVAAALMRREQSGHTLQATALIHEAYLRLIDPSSVDAKNRRHFIGIAARSMRQILVDHARRRKAGKRGGDWDRVTLDAAVALHESAGVDLLDLHEALNALAELDERKARVVELRFFGGLTTDEAADVLEVSPKTAEADWYMARAWLRARLGDGDTSPQ